MKLLLSLSVIIGAIVMASTLTCNVCNFRFLFVCIGSSSTISCTGNCSLTQTFAGSAPFFSQQACDTNCVSNTTTQKENVFGLNYVKTCCSTDLCNSGNSAKLSLSLGLSMLLLWLLKCV
ncbi:hypothetical protein XENTR_v10021294 [Xenopus tropicalis]|uniref:Lymphocyte antigen 6 complex locus protein G6c n=1 Tax=Xenopus tropicalis TaxID=8364 RepID=A0A8J1IS82_XENTR|nr:lymphocyte antigen 6 complex locus protein G6c [Xenopus tropicalis]KAE8585372.1 hypothetical protein XENTR_v10021294 [Xenopus tropicalis]